MIIPRLVVMASGGGSIAQAIFDSVAAKDLKAEIVGLISDKADAQVLKRARDCGIKSFTLPMNNDRITWDKEIVETLDLLRPDLVASAGFMRILSKECVEKFRIINSHPALLPHFPGAHAVRDTLAAGVSQSGSTIHWVDSGVDTGEIIAQEAVEVLATDTQATLHERIKIVERRLYVATLQQLLFNIVRS
ncbi:MAG: phosphoribosylglycinamide formyltransferase [Candidatus Planktophila sp.]|jgi:phosphoribosylglycinamide formyltransferase 1|tara:strand:+ start:7751 stop:8323 length:573 start_codon:yes stop_codon:yes gene_type:complete